MQVGAASGHCTPSMGALEAAPGAAGTGPADRNPLELNVSELMNGSRLPRSSGLESAWRASERSPLMNRCCTDLVLTLDQTWTTGPDGPPRGSTTLRSKMQSPSSEA